jgi:hypothetical protein
MSSSITSVNPSTFTFSKPLWTVTTSDKLCGQVFEKTLKDLHLRIKDEKRVEWINLGRHFEDLSLESYFFSIYGSRIHHLDLTWFCKPFSQFLLYFPNLKTLKVSLQFDQTSQKIEDLSNYSQIDKVEDFTLWINGNFPQFFPRYAQLIEKMRGLKTLVIYIEDLSFNNTLWCCKSIINSAKGLPNLESFELEKFYTEPEKNDKYVQIFAGALATGFKALKFADFRGLTLDTNEKVQRVVQALIKGKQKIERISFDLRDSIHNWDHSDFLNLTEIYLRLESQDEILNLLWERFGEGKDEFDDWTWSDDEAQYYNKIANELAALKAKYPEEIRTKKYKTMKECERFQGLEFLVEAPPTLKIYLRRYEFKDSEENISVEKAISLS